MCSVYLHAGEARLLDRCSTDTEAPHDILYLRCSQRHRFAELPAGQPQLHSRGRLGMGVHIFLRLAAGVTDLRPEMVATARTGPRPVGQRAAHGGVGFPVDHNIAGAFQVVGIHLDIARQ